MGNRKGGKHKICTTPFAPHLVLAVIYILEICIEKENQERSWQAKETRTETNRRL